MLQRLTRQFSGPRGPLGYVAGFLMSRMNVQLNQWAVDLMELGPFDRICEIGFGPGLAVELAASRATSGFVAGVDLSEVMLAQASRRNRAAIAAGRVELRCGTAAELPFADASFTRACAVNSLQFWPEPEAGIREIHRVLSPGGRLVLALRMRRTDVGRYSRSRFGFTEKRAVAVRQMLEKTGFTPSATTREIRGETIRALVGRR